MARRNSGQKVQFPKYKGTLLRSLLSLEKTGVFAIERKENGKHDIHRHGIKPPLPSFQARGPYVTRCVFRIRDKELVGEYEGKVLIRTDRHFIYASENEQVYYYKKIVAYLSEFL